MSGKKNLSLLWTPPKGTLLKTTNEHVFATESGCRKDHPHTLQKTLMAVEARGGLKHMTAPKEFFIV